MSSANNLKTQMMMLLDDEEYVLRLKNVLFEEERSTNRTVSIPKVRVQRGEIFLLSIL
jgi:hypothetical protein